MSAQPGVSASSIGSAAIVPGAEPTSSDSMSSVTAGQEKNFFDQGKADYDFKTAHVNLGVLGRFFGRDNGTVYVVGIVVVLALVGLIATIFCASTPAIADGQKYLAGIVTTGLGFFAGSAVRKSD